MVEHQGVALDHLVGDVAENGEQNRQDNGNLQAGVTKEALETIDDGYFAALE
ncbi:MAG: hypothetical protein ACOH2M_16595 [Cypionkella sp.]